MMKPFDPAARAAMEADVHIGDRFVETAPSRRTLELVSVLRPYSGLLHGRLRNVERPQEIHLMSFQALRDKTRYTRAGDGAVPQRAIPFARSARQAVSGVFVPGLAGGVSCVTGVVASAAVGDLDAAPQNVSVLI